MTMQIYIYFLYTPIILSLFLLYFIIIMIIPYILWGIALYLYTYFITYPI
jgi:hypothetical protein